MKNAKNISLLVGLLLVAGVLAGCTGGDGDDEESHPAMEDKQDGWEITITTLGGGQETRHVFPSERGHDYDRDDQDDLQEFLQGTDPNDADTSDNGLLDGNNVVLGPEEHPAPEWIDRGIAYEELHDGRFEFQGAFNWSVDPTMQDTAGNGILDGDEVRGYEVWVLGERRIVKTAPLEFDTSGDGMGDGFKRDAGLDPSTRDTDGDGTIDHSDVNPWIDFQLRLEVVSLNITSSEHGSQVPLRFDLFLQDAPWQSPTQSVQVGDTADGAPFSSGALSPSDGGGDFRQGRHNTSFSLTAISENDNDQAVDLFSKTTGSTSLVGAIHALTGELHHGQGEGRQPWPATATFEGDHGDVTLRLVPVWPEAWQSCIDDGCRHGDGDFQWR